MTAFDSISDEALSQIQMVALCSSMVGLGWGLGVIWTAAKTMQAAPKAPPLWALELVGEYRSLAMIGGILLLGGTLVVIGLEYVEDVRADTEPSEEASGTA